MPAVVGAVFFTAAGICEEAASAKGALDSAREASTTAAMNFFFIAAAYSFAL